jgi:hypothetical protein
MKVHDRVENLFDYEGSILHLEFSQNYPQNAEAKGTILFP